MTAKQRDETDLRMHVGCPDDPKIDRLCRKLGDTAFRCLWRLWAWARTNRTDGRLHGLDGAYVAKISGWTKQPGKWIEALTAADTRFLDEGPGGVWQLHEWEQHQWWASGAQRRSESARENALKRWQPVGNAPADAGAHAPALRRQSGPDAPSLPTYQPSDPGGRLRARTPDHGPKSPDSGGGRLAGRIAETEAWLAQAAPTDPMRAPAEATLGRLRAEQAALNGHGGSR